MNVDAEVIAKLEAPGAGLPKVELLAAKMLFGWKRAWATKASATALIKAEREAMLKLTRGCSTEQGRQRVLIERLRGMEDSSRYWSVFMTLEHVRIVNMGCLGAIRSLARGQVPDRVASTATVKPSPEVGKGVLEEFEQACELLIKTAEGAGSLRTPVRYAHPWFGPLDAAGWHFVAGFHMQLHRKQMEAITVGLV